MKSVIKYTVRPQKDRVKVVSSSLISNSTRRAISAADEEDNEDVFGPGLDDLEDDTDFNDTLDDVADTVEDIQDAVDEVDEDDVNIETDNNISGHYIVECDGCHGIFISAMIESDQQIEKISGVCPLCEKETDQYPKWVIKDVEADSEK